MQDEGTGAMVAERDLEDAGRVDGPGYWGVLRRLAFPNAWPR